MENNDLENVLKIKNEITYLLKDIDKKENNLLETIKNNMHNILVYKSFLEDIIEEYHNICTQIYKQKY
jgi:hypothetical protein